MNAPSPPEPTPKPTSIWKWVGIGCGAVSLLLIGLAVGLFFLVKETMNMSMDPQKAEQTAKSIMDYNIPGGSRGFMAMNISGLELAGVMSAQEGDAVVLILGKMPSTMQSDPKQLQEAFQQNAENQMGSDFQVKQQRTESKKLCGQTVAVNVLEGEKNASSGAPAPAFSYQALVPHQGNTLLVTLTTTGSNAQSTADTIFNSLNCK